MNAYEVTKPDGSRVTLNASGWTQNHAKGSLAFFDANAQPVARFSRGQWLSMHMRSPIVKADRPDPPLTSAEFIKEYGL